MSNSIKFQLRFIALIVATAITTSSLGAENWPQWRGPKANGIAPGKGYPTRWSDTDNVAWKVALPGWGTSTPAVWNDRVFVTYQDEGRNALVCLDRRGKKLWATNLGTERRARNRKASGSNPSPVTDGEHVWVYYKSGDFACIDFEGTVVWQKNLQKEYGEDTLWWDLGTSPMLTKDLVVVACMHSGPSYLAGFDKSTGQVVWKHARELNAPREAAQSYTTPSLITDNGKETIVVLGADHVTAHDAIDGSEIWRVGGLNPRESGNFRSISSPLVTDGLVIAPYARGNSLTAIRLGGKGDVTKSHVAWVNEEDSADVPTPTSIDGRIYVCGDRGEITCLDATSGERVWSDRFAPSRTGRYAFSSSPIVADGILYATREDGMTFVIKLGDEYKLLETNGLYEWVLATPVFVDGQILIRTAEHLYCIGKK